MDLYSLHAGTNKMLSERFSECDIVWWFNFFKKKKALTVHIHMNSFSYYGV
jgi:hypothetical protein